MVDKTGLKGYWAYDVSYESSSLPPRLEASTASALPLPIALEEQLGLRLEPGSGPVDVLIVDCVEQPTDN